MTKTLLSITFLAIGLVAVVLLSCRKETDSLIEIYAESFGGDTKLMVANDTTSVWEDHDRIRINGTTAEVIRNANGHAYITATAASDVNMALFPDTLCDSAITSEVVTINLPAEYKYKTGAGGKQSLPVPMAAISASNSPLHFRHLTGALLLRIEDNLTLESITVISDKYQLSGSRTLRFADIEGQQPVETLDPAQRRVTMLFDAQQVTSSIDVMIPIAPVGADNHFTIEIEARREGTRYHFRRTQETGGALGRNILATTAITVIGNDDFTTIGPLFEGTGASSSPYQISSPNEFLAMVDAVNNGWTDPVGNNPYRNGNYRLTDSIDMQGITINPIKNFINGKTFYGNGKAIKNLTIRSSPGSTDACCGLFDTLRGSSKIDSLIIRNVTLKHTGVSPVTLCVSPICADGRNCSIKSCTVDGVTIVISGTITGIQYGAMIGHVGGGTVTINNCKVKGSVATSTLSNTLHFGGIIGRIEGGGIANISNCKVLNQTVSIVSSSQINAGGIIGNMATGTTATISSTSWNGNMSFEINSGTSTMYVGGMVGRFVNNGESLTIDDACYLSGSISTSSNNTINLGAYIGWATNPTYSNITVPSAFPTGLTLKRNNVSWDKLIGNN